MQDGHRGQDGHHGRHGHHGRKAMALFLAVQDSSIGDLVSQSMIK